MSVLDRSSSNAQDISTYFQQAATLRLCLQYNMDDYEFSRRGGNIIYLMDANIVRFFLNPHSEISHVAAFGRTRAAREVYGPATAALTAEFLFSRQLVGQQDRPAFITPGHGEDVLDVINGLRNAIDRGDTSGAEISPATLEKLNVLLDRLLPVCSSRKPPRLTCANLCHQLQVYCLKEGFQRLPT